MVFSFKNKFDVSDIRINGNPQVTFFKSVYRRHTPFSIIEKNIVANGGDQGNDISFLEGDLLKSVKLQMITNSFSDVIDHNIGTEILDHISLFVNDKKIEDLKGEYLDMYMQLNNPLLSPQTFYSSSGTSSDSTLVLNEGTMDQILSFSGGVFNQNNLSASNINIILPIPFSFCVNIGNVLPTFLFAKTKNVYIRFKLKKKYESIFDELSLIYEKIFISDIEKLRFKSSNNEYIHQNINSFLIDNNYNMIPPNFGTISALYWKKTSLKSKYNVEIYDKKLITNSMSFNYFTRQSIFKSGYTGFGRKVEYVNNASMVVNDDSICVYNFGLKEKSNYIGDTDEYTPNGSISVSSNNVSFIVDDDDPFESFNLYVKSYNILNISSNEFYLRYVH